MIPRYTAIINISLKNRNLVQMGFQKLLFLKFINFERVESTVPLRLGLVDFSVDSLSLLRFGLLNGEELSEVIHKTLL